MENRRGLCSFIVLNSTQKICIDQFEQPDFCKPPHVRYAPCIQHSIFVRVEGFNKAELYGNHLQRLKPTQQTILVQYLRGGLDHL